MPAGDAIVIRGGTVVSGAGTVRAEVAIRDGKIAAILAPGESPKAE